MKSTNQSPMFLQPTELAELTGIKNGKKGKPREACQIEALKKMKVPHFVNAIGRPIVSRAVIECVGMAVKYETWKPTVL